jgi:threonine synthase
MATICKKCGGTVPDIIPNGNLSDYSDCKNHRKPEINFKYDSN